jgi:chemotaxis protein methyltransferase CheR
MARPDTLIDPDLEEIEVDLLIEALRRRYGYDFRHYARASLWRRLREYAQRSGYPTVAAIIPALLHQPAELDRLINGISVTVTEMFRDPAAFTVLAREVVPWLRSHAFFKVWVAGCSTGEEAYSLAILLDEEGLLDRAQIYATDINTGSIEVAHKGSYALDVLQRAENNYAAAGGRRALSDHYAIHRGRGRMSERLRRRVVFTQHNLATDSVFGKIELVVCRNVLIYFDRALQDRVARLFADALAHRGFLQLGSRETLRFVESGRRFESVNDDVRLYRLL